ncbi:MAG: transporter substrate-binding domain-containing protein [Synechococcus sp. s2_metabat2_7]|nr:transporter substrate-binding domain-containing protein [Synechococcus sp. s2_metabat2_7]
MDCSKNVFHEPIAKPAMRRKHVSLKKKALTSLAVVALPISALFLIGHPSLSQQQETNQSQKNASITVGTVDNNLPCSDKIDEHFEGYSIDIWRRISERLNIEYQIVTSKSYDEAVMMAANGKVDIVTSCHDITPERLQIVEYSIPYTSGGIVIISRRAQRPVMALALKLINNQIILRCGILLILITGLTAFALKVRKRQSKRKKDYKQRKYFRLWTILILNDGVDTLLGSRTRENLLVLTSSLLHVLLMSAIIGTIASIVFEENIAFNTSKLGSNELIKLLKEGLVVQEGTSYMQWVESRMKRAGIGDNYSVPPRLVSTKKEMLEEIGSTKPDKPSHFVSNITTYKYNLRQVGNSDEFEISYQQPNKTPQAFIFGSGMNSKLKQRINIEISKMNRSGLTDQIESDWKD